MSWLLNLGPMSCSCSCLCSRWIYGRNTRLNSKMYRVDLHKETEGPSVGLAATANHLITFLKPQSNNYSSSSTNLHLRSAYLHTDAHHALRNSNINFKFSSINIPNKCTAPLLNSRRNSYFFIFYRHERCFEYHGGPRGASANCNSFRYAPCLLFGSPGGPSWPRDRKEIIRWLGNNWKTKIASTNHGDSKIFKLLSFVLCDKNCVKTTWILLNTKLYVAFAWLSRSRANKNYLFRPSKFSLP